MQQVEIEIISAEAGKARFASARYAISRHVIWPHFGDQKNTVALTDNHVADQLLRAAAAIYLGGVDQSHAERKACAKRFFLLDFRMPSLRESRRPLTESRDDGAVREFHGTS